MSRNVHHLLRHPAPPRGAWVFATSVLVAIALPVVGFPTSGCEHAESVKELERNAKNQITPDGTGGSGSGGGPGDGVVTWIDLVGSETPIGDDTYTGTPLVDEEGRTFVLAVGDEFELLGVNELPGLYWSTPSTAGDSLLLRAADRLTCIRAE